MQGPIVEDVNRPEEQAGPACRHHWIIATPQGATSFGRCKLCSDVREFPNSAGDSMWEGDPMRSIGKMGNSRRSSQPATANKDE